jgi:hypothetical protein
MPTLPVMRICLLLSTVDTVVVVLAPFERCRVNAFAHCESWLSLDRGPRRDSKRA